MQYDYRKLKAAFDQTLLSQSELALKVGLSEGAVSLVLNGKAPWKKAIRKISSYLGVTNVVLPERRAGRHVA